MLAAEKRFMNMARRASGIAVPDTAQVMRSSMFSFHAGAFEEARPFPALPCERWLRSVCMVYTLAEADSKTLFKHIEIEFFRQDIKGKLMIVFYR